MKLTDKGKKDVLDLGMSKLFKTMVVWGVVLAACLFSGGSVWAQSSANQIETYEARIVKILEDREIELEGVTQPYQKLEAIILNKDKKGQILIIENGNLPLANVVKYKEDDKVLVNAAQDLAGEEMYVIIDSVRTDSLILLGIIFILMTMLVTKLRGVMALLSLVASFLVIFYFLLPKIYEGWDPVLTASLASAVIIPITFYMSHGFNKKTSVAVLGTLIALIITGLMAKIFIELSSLQGMSSEEAGFLAGIKKGAVDMRGLLLAGIMIGALGVLDDVTVSQSSIVQQLREASDKLKPKEIYAKAMKVGQDHITSMINTLILVYTGVSLPLLLIFVDNPHPFGEIVNYEFIAEEIVRTLVGSIGLILAVPITTLIAVGVFGKKR